MRATSGTTRLVISEVRSRAGLSQEGLARLLGVSFVSVNRWERGASQPSPAQAERILKLRRSLDDGTLPRDDSRFGIFASHGARRLRRELPLFEENDESFSLLSEPKQPVLHRLHRDGIFSSQGTKALVSLIAKHTHASRTVTSPPAGGMSAGKNSYTYDAHTYHTKVPPQGIAELLRHYLPAGGLVLDPFAGSGMTGVAAIATGHDCILNELSPAACFVSNRFLAKVDPVRFGGAVDLLMTELKELRGQLYVTTCRECGREAELLYTVWSYRVICSHCTRDFLLWDVCRKYGSRVREHKILSEFDCPRCGRHLSKSRLVRTSAEPVQIGYICCGSRQQEVVHPPTPADVTRLQQLEADPPLADSYVPRVDVPDGVNLSQPKRHGLDRVDKFYSARNLAALTHLWRTIHRVDDVELAAHLAFVFTSLYQRVTKLSEFRFWGGSGNTARFNVPFIFNEANVFVTFERKAKSIRDHLETTAQHYSGTPIVVNGSATNLAYVPDSSVDLIFTDPPFGANINYSEMNLLWESWLGAFTDNTHEAIVNRSQGKDVAKYQELMTLSLRECHRVLRPGHWMLLVFMNSSARIWAALRAAIVDAGFKIVQADSFDKQHGTFKQFVSSNTAGEDLVLHCWKLVEPLSSPQSDRPATPRESLCHFLERIDVDRRRTVYLHVARMDEVDVRRLYSEWMASAVLEGVEPIDLADFRKLVITMLSRPGHCE